MINWVSFKFINIEFAIRKPFSQPLALVSFVDSYYWVSSLYIFTEDENVGQRVCSVAFRWDSHSFLEYFSRTIAQKYWLIIDSKPLVNSNH